MIQKVANAPLYQFNGLTYVLALIALIGPLSIQPAQARIAIHPVSLSSAIVEVREDELIVDLEIMLEDLVMYQSLAADGEMRYSAEQLRQAAKQHRDFLLEYFSILDVDGNRLKETDVAENFEQITDEGALQNELMSKVVTYRVQYQLKNTKPKFLTFLQTFGGKNSALPAIMDLSVWHRDRKEHSSQLAFGKPQSFRFDWERAYENNRPSFAELRKKRKEQFEDSLGVASYTGLYSFVYINRFEVRHELLVPLLTLEQWVKVPRKDPDFLEVEEQNAAKDSIAQFFAEKCIVQIDGQSNAGSLTRLNFFGLDIADFALNADPRKVSVHQARVGIIWTYPSKKTPKDVKLTWQAYSEFAPFLNSVVLVGNESPTRHVFHSLEPDLKWQGNLLGPTNDKVSVISSSPSEQEAKQITEAILANIYRAFDFREDEDVYEALDSVVDGPVLRDIYLRVKRSLIMAEQGGTLAHANSVTISELTKTGKKNFDFEIKWQVVSVSEHWGHIHKQTTEFRAKLSLIQKSGFWKLNAFQLLDEKKIKFETSIRGNDQRS
ncbi:MAG: hypothetical protein ACK5YR_25105 [Pirellula sp.]|jgi:hypothetical protein